MLWHPGRRARPSRSGSATRSANAAGRPAAHGHAVRGADRASAARSSGSTSRCRASAGSGAAALGGWLVGAPRLRQPRRPDGRGLRAPAPSSPWRLARAAAVDDRTAGCPASWTSSARKATITAQRACDCHDGLAFCVACRSPYVTFTFRFPSRSTVGSRQWRSARTAQPPPWPGMPSIAGCASSGGPRCGRPSRHTPRGGGEPRGSRSRSRDGFARGLRPPPRTRRRRAR